MASWCEPENAVKTRSPPYGCALGHRQLVAVLHGAADFVDVGEVDHRVDALDEHVQAQGHQVHVAGPLAVAEQAAFDPVRAGQVAQLGGRDAGAAVVVRVQGQDDALPRVQVAAHPLDGVGVDVGGGHFHRGRQVDDDLAVGGGLEDVGDGVADPDGVLQLGPGEGFRRVLVGDVGVLQGLLVLLAQPRALQGDVQDAVLVLVEDDPALQDRRRVVQVHDGLLGADQGLVGPLDQVLAGLGQDLDGDVVRDVVALDQLADEVEVRLRGGGEPDFDFLVAHPDQQLEHLQLAGGAHRVDQGLVAVAQVHGAPARGLGDDLVRPGAVRQFNRDQVLERDVAVDGHS